MSQKGHVTSEYTKLIEECKALKENEKRLRLIVENTPDPIYIKDQESRMVMANSACEHAMGHSIDEMLGKSDAEIYADPKIGQNILETDKRIMNSGKTQVVEEDIATPEGRRIYLSTKTPLFDDSGKVIGIFGISRDITERKKAEEALRKSEEDYQALFTNMSDGFAFCRMIYEKDKPTDFIYLQINNAFEKITGLRREQVVNKRASEAIPGTKETNPELFEIYGRVASTMKKEKFEVFFKPLSLWLSISVYSPIQGYFAAVFEDITEHKKAEEKVSRLASFPMLNPSPIVEVDYGGKINYLNPTAMTLFPEIEKIGLKHPFFSQWKVIINKLKENTSAFSLEVKITQDWYIQQCYKVPGTDCIRIYAMDITKRKQVEEKLHKNEERLNMAQEIGRIGSWEFHVKEGKALWSEELFRIFELPVQAFGPDIREYRGFIHSEDIERVTKIIEPFTFNGFFSQVVKFDYRIVLRNGSVRTLHTERVVLEVDQTGKPSVIMGIEQDITERKEIELQLEKYSKNLEKVVEERTKQLKDSEHLATIGQTAGMVGHDIRNPLQAMTSDVYLVKSSLDSIPDSTAKQEIRESFESIEKNIDYVNKIVQDLQDYARQIVPTKKEIMIASILNDVLVKRAVPSNIEVFCKIDVGAEKIVADPDMLKRILTNLVNNAVQAMPNGGKLALHAFRKAMNVIISVEDTGTGIPKDARDKLFTPLFTTKSKGQGFGLAVVKRLTEAMGGKVSFESEEDKGTKFIIELPTDLTEGV